MSLEQVQQALIAQFQTAFPTWLASKVAWENKAFTPPAAGAWMAFHFLPVDENISTLGATGYDEANGLVQIDLNVPTGTGEAGSRATINELRACYKPQAIAYQTQTVSILSRSRSNGRTTDGFFRIPFTVRWRAKLNRT